MNFNDPQKMAVNEFRNSGNLGHLDIRHKKIIFWYIDQLFTFLAGLQSNSGLWIDVCLSVCQHFG